MAVKNTIPQGITSLKKTVKDNVKYAIRTTLGESTNSAKANANWTDRTGNARNSIVATAVQQDGTKFSGAFGIAVDYGIWLELKNQGKYRIIAPTLQTVTTTALTSYMKALLV